MTALDTTANDELWRAYLTGDDASFIGQRRRYKRLPGKPRCKACLVPLGGAGGRAMRLLKGVEASRKSPNFCNFCDQFARTRPGSAEIELSLLFADVRGSTAIAEGMGATEFGRLMNRFYDAANRVLIDSDAMVDKLVGDEVIGL
jgi:adenylate cyclase